MHSIVFSGSMICLSKSVHSLYLLKYNQDIDELEAHNLSSNFNNLCVIVFR